MESIFGKRKNRPRQSSIVAQDADNRLNRPLSSTSVSTARSDTRGSRYAPSSFSAEPHHHHLSALYKHASPDEFSFPRPENDEEIEMLFDNIMRVRGLDENIPNLSIDQQWHMVYNDEQMRWNEERRRDEQARKQIETGQPAAIVEGTPEWYIRKFLDKTITPKQASSLQVSLRSKEMRSALLSV